MCLKITELCEGNSTVFFFFARNLPPEIALPIQKNWLSSFYPYLAQEMERRGGSVEELLHRQIVFETFFPLKTG